MDIEQLTDELDGIELTDKDEKRMSQIKFRRHDSGLYFDYFETKQMAYKFLKVMAERYRATGLHNNTVKDLCLEAMEAGIRLHRQTFSKWLKEVFNIKVRYTGGAVSGEEKTRVSYSISQRLHERMKGLVKKSGVTIHKRSWMLNTLLKPIMGLKISDLIVIIDDDELVEVLFVFFYWEKGQMKALYTLRPSQGTRKLIQSLTDDGKRHGMGYLERKAQSLGYLTIGNDYDRKTKG